MVRTSYGLHMLHLDLLFSFGISTFELYSSTRRSSKRNCMGCTSHARYPDPRHSSRHISSIGHSKNLHTCPLFLTAVSDALWPSYITRRWVASLSILPHVLPGIMPRTTKFNASSFLDSVYGRCPSAYHLGIWWYKYPSPEYLTGFEGAMTTTIYLPYVFHITLPCMHQLIRILNEILLRDNNLTMTIYHYQNAMCIPDAMYTASCSTSW